MIKFKKAINACWEGEFLQFGDGAKSLRAKHLIPSVFQQKSVKGKNLFPDRFACMLTELMLGHFGNGRS
jgi:hypothetical protein